MPEDRENVNAYMRDWRRGKGKQSYETTKAQQRARGRALRRLSQRHHREFARLYAEECQKAGVPAPVTTL